MASAGSVRNYQRRPLPKEETAMSIRRCPVPIVNFILPKGVKFSYCRKSHNPSDVSLKITISPIFAIHFENP